MLEVMKMQNKSLSKDQRIEKPDYELYIETIADDIISTQTPRQVMNIRNKFYELLVHCIPPNEIIKVS